MKSKTVFWFMLISMLSLMAYGQRKQINLVATLGAATVNIDKVIVNLGVEMEVFHNFYAQVSFDSLFEGASTMANSQNGRVSFSQTMRSQVFGMNIMGNFKLPFGRQMAWLFKAGFSYTHRFRYYYNDYYHDNFDFYRDWHDGYYDYYPERYSNANQTPIQTGLTYALGTGIEYRLNDKLGLVGGGTFESLFKRTQSAAENKERGDWVKFCVGFNYRLR